MAPLTPVTTSSGTIQTSRSNALNAALFSGKPTPAEFGASTYIPCKQMKPILEELAIEYKDKLNVVIEVYEQMDLARNHRIITIPTQILFDADGKEITRHFGLWPKEQIVSQLRKMGIE
ncbi:thioredoxin family protein [Chloroflexota bacterium]